MAIVTITLYFVTFTKPCCKCHKMNFTKFVLLLVQTLFLQCASYRFQHIICWIDRSYTASSKSQKSMDRC